MTTPTPPAGSLQLFEMFETVARRRPSRALLRTIGGGTAMTAAGILDASLRLAGRLAEAGVQAGDTVLLARASGAPFAIGVLACWRRGAAVLPAEAGLPEAELSDLQRVFAPSVVMTPDAGAGLFSLRAGPRPAPPRVAAGAAVIKLTSGSTGTPRGVACTAAQLAADASAILKGMGIGPEDVQVAVIPMSHSYGLSSLLMPMVVQGSPLLLVPSSVPELLVEALAIDEPAVFPGVPVLYELLARQAAPLRPAGLRLCISAGAPLSARTARGVLERSGLPVRAFYGTSETGGIAYDASVEGDAAMASEGCVGTALPGVAVDLEPETSRVVVRSPSVAAGYVGEARDRGASSGFRDGAFLTGDSGSFAERGGRLELTLTGRLSGTINVAGRKVDPREIERVFAQLDGVMEIAVVGVPDPSRGESLAAFVVAEPGRTRENLLAQLRGRLAAWKVPRQILFVDAMPRTERGKVNAEALRKRAAESIRT